MSEDSQNIQLMPATPGKLPQKPRPAVPQAHSSYIRIPLPDNLALALGRIFKYYRGRLNISQVNIATYTSTNVSYYSLLECGKSNISFVKFLSICECLQVYPEKILHELYTYDENDIRFTEFHKIRSKRMPRRRKMHPRQLLQKQETAPGVRNNASAISSVLLPPQ